MRLTLAIHSIRVNPIPIANFVSCYNHQRYHKALGDVKLADVLYGRIEQILQHRKEVRIQTVNHRRDCNQTPRELAHAA